jgi:hypothetical protein
VSQYATSSAWTKAYLICKWNKHDISFMLLFTTTVSSLMRHWLNPSAMWSWSSTRHKVLDYVMYCKITYFCRGVIIAKMKIFKGFPNTTLPWTQFLDSCRHNMTKTWNKIPAKISDFKVSYYPSLWVMLHNSYNVMMSYSIHVVRLP